MDQMQPLQTQESVDELPGIMPTTKTRPVHQTEMFGERQCGYDPEEDGWRRIDFGKLKQNLKQNIKIKK